MVKKIKWSVLMNQISAEDCIHDLISDISDIDELLNSYIEDSSIASLENISTVVESIIDDSGNSSIWKDMNIYVSSWKEYDNRFIYLIQAKLREYLAFYKKILTDEGIQRNLVYSKEYSNSGSASSVERGTDSVTPQNSNLYDSQHPESDALFDEAIANYASGINKNKGSTTSSSSGSSGTSVTGVTWDEAKKNIQMLFFNELKDYLVSIPERIYSWYSLETIPAPELCKLFLEYREAIWDLVNE